MVGLLAQSSPPLSLIDKGELGLLFYFILALLGMMLSGLGAVWMMLSRRDLAHEKHLNSILAVHSAELDRILKAHADERRLVHENSQAALRDLRQEIRSNTARLDRLNEGIFSLIHRLEEEG